MKLPPVWSEVGPVVNSKSAPHPTSMHALATSKRVVIFVQAMRTMTDKTRITQRSSCRFVRPLAGLKFERSLH